MKEIKLFTSLALLIFVQTALYAQWNKIYNSSNGELTAIECMNEDTVFVAGYISTIFRTFDKGETWQIIDPGFEIVAKDMNFPDKQTGYIVGPQGRIAKTTDCGENWELIVTDTNYRLGKAEFIHPDTGWIIGTNMGLIDGIILKTINGGINWEYFYPDDNIELFDIKMVNSLKGFVGIETWFSDNYGFLKTVDGGDTWVLSNPGMDMVTNISFVDEEVGYCLGLLGGIVGGTFKTIDGGETWSFMEGGVGGYSFNRLQFLNEQTGFYAGWEVMFDDGKISRTDDGANTWTDQITGSFLGIDMLNADTGYAITVDGGIYKTINGGTPVGISEPNKSQANKLIVFPNPVTNSFELKINPNLLLDHRQLSFILYDQKGIKVKQIKDIKVSEFEITRTNLSPGIYFYTLTDRNNIIESDKLIIK